MKPLSLIEEEYLCSLIENDVSAHQRETGIERLCALLEKGFLLNKPNQIAKKLIACFYDPNPKVRRWSLSAVALLAYKTRATIDVMSIIEAIKRNEDYPDVMCSGFAAIFTTCGDEKAIQLIKEHGLSLEDAFILYSSQYSEVMLQEIRDRKVNIYNASDLMLKNTSVLIGLNKAPENIFDPKYPNQEILGILNSHDNPKVAQYSIWALVENDNYSIKDLGLDLKDIESFKENVRAYVYRLMTENEEAIIKHKEYVYDVASKDHSDEAREGLARSLKEVYADGIENCILPWVNSESVTDIQDCLYDHMASNANRCDAYEEWVKARFKGAMQNSDTRNRLLVCSQGKPLHRELKKIEFSEQHQSLDLFNNGRTTVKNDNSIHIHGNASVGQLATSGGTNLANDLTNRQKINDAELAKLLEQFVNLVEGSHLEQEKKIAAKEVADEMKKAPQESYIKRILQWISMIKAGAGDAAEIAENANQLYETFESLVA